MSSGYRFSINTYRACRCPFASCPVPVSQFSLAYKLAFYNSNSWTPTADELQYHRSSSRTSPAERELRQRRALPRRCPGRHPRIPRSHKHVPSTREHQPFVLPSHPYPSVRVTPAGTHPRNISNHIAHLPSITPTPIHSTVPPAHAYVPHRLHPLPTQHAEHHTTTQLFLANNPTSP